MIQNLYLFIPWLFNIYYIMLFIRILLSWFPHNRTDPIISFIYQYTEPVLAPFRQLLNQYLRTQIDFSPILAFFALDFLLDVTLYILRLFMR